jgi:hypothetical protein
MKQSVRSIRFWFKIAITFLCAAIVWFGHKNNVELDGENERLLSQNEGLQEKFEQLEQLMTQF